MVAPHPEQTGLVRYDAMCLAIAECHKVDEVTEIRHRARALEVYAAQAMNRDSERKAAEIRIRAERRAGQLLQEMKQLGKREKQGGNRTAKSRDTILKLADIGISNDQAADWQKLAEVSQDQFEEALSQPHVMPTTQGVLAATGKLAPIPKLHLDHDALRAYGQIADFEKIMGRPANELFRLMPDFQQEKMAELIPVVIAWLEEMV